MSAPTLAEQLAAWAVGLSYDDVPEAVLAAARRHLLDGLGTALAAARAGVVGAAVQVATGLGGPPEARILGTGTAVSAPAAALANGALVHGLDFDDTHAGGLVHATAAVLPAALAVGEQVGADGRELLTAAVVGYEVVCRVAAASPHGFHARGLHATQVAGTLAAAAVSAKLLGLDAATMTNALGIAGSSSGGLLEFLSTGASTKALHPGSAGMSAILAARLAAAGATGPTTVLEGPRGIYAALSARPADLDSVVEGLGSTMGDDADNDQAVPVVPADARHPRRGPPAGPVTRRRRRGGRGRRAPGLGVGGVGAGRSQGRAAHVLRREVLAAMVGGRAAARR